MAMITGGLGGQAASPKEQIAHYLSGTLEIAYHFIHRQAYLFACRTHMYTQQRSNIFLIIVDALRPDHLSCYGYRRETSPEIDRLALEGCQFERVMSQSSWTKPAVASLLTGTYPDSHGVTSITDALSGSDHYLPTLLRQAGYTTVCIQTNPFLSRESGFGQGFDHYMELFDQAAGVYKPRAPEAIIAVADWLDHYGAQPFFLYLHLLDAHNPYMPPDSFSGFGNREQDRYDGEIYFIDRHIGLVRDMLLKKGIYEKTILIVTADHGEEFGEHGYQYHAKHLYQEVLRVPLIITAPGVVSPYSTISSQIRSIDIVPTILELAGLPPVNTHQGASLLPFLREGCCTDRPALSQIGSSQGSSRLNLISLSAGDYKLILNTHADTTELYHLAQDPQEQYNLAHEEQSVARHLSAQIQTILRPGGEKVGGSTTPAAKGGSEEVTFTDEIRQQLRGLGYLE